MISMDNTSIYGDIIYTYSLKKAIEEGQLCDYKIIAPVITCSIFYEMLNRNDLAIETTNRKPIEIRYYMSAYLLARSIKERGLKHILTFNNTNAGARIFNILLEDILNKMNMQCKCYLLTGLSSMNNRRRVVNDFTKDEVAVISSARIFTEGVDIPIVDTVCFVDNKMSVTDIIQSVGRPLRLHKDKEIAHIIIPTILNYDDELNLDSNSIFDVNPKDFGVVKSILKTISTVDSRIIDQFVIKTKGKKYDKLKRFQMDTTDIVNYATIKFDMDEMSDKMDLTIVDRWGMVNWYQKRDLLFEYVDEKNRIPQFKTVYKDVKLGVWLNSQKNRLTGDSYKILSENHVVKQELDRYIDDKNKRKDKRRLTFNDKVNLLFEYVNEKNRVPQFKTVYKDVNLGAWLNSQKNRLTGDSYNRLSENHIVKQELDRYLKNKKRSIDIDNHITVT